MPDTNLAGASLSRANTWRKQQQLPLIDDGGQVFNCRAKRFGAKGDGVTDDTAAIQAACDAAGVGGTILVPRGTYVVSGPITLANKQVLHGDRSILKRANQIVTTAGADVTVGSSTIQVAALNGLRVGHLVTVATGVPLPTTGQRVASAGTGYLNGETVTFTGGLAPGGTAATGHITASGGLITGLVIDTQGSGYVSSPKVTINTVSGTGGVVVPPWPNPVYDPINHKITAIVGNTLTLANPFTVGFNSGAAVYQVWHGITSTGGGTRIYDLLMNGNRANWTFYPWECVAEIELVGDRYLVQGCEMYECPGEGIVAFGNYNSYDNCWIHDLNGNGIHFSGTTHTTVDAVRVINGNQDQSVGHGYRAGIAWSALVADVTITNCYVENCLNGLGAIKVIDNSDGTLLGNTIRNCWESGISLLCGTTDTGPSGILMSGNRIYDCPIGINVNQTSFGTTVWPSQLVISGNYLEDNPLGLLLARARYVSVVGNIFKAPSTAAYTHLLVSNSANVAIGGGNVFRGARYGVYLETNGQTANVQIIGNLFAGQNLMAINFDGLGMAGCSVNNNEISNDATASNNYIGINASAPASIANNRLNLTNNGGVITGVTGILVNAPMSTQSRGCNLQGNEVRGTAQYGIRNFGGSGQCVIAGNLTTATTILITGGVVVTTPAVLSFTLSGGAITGVTVVSGGSYTGTPLVNALDSAGTGATFTATMSGSAIASVAVTNGGSSYMAPTASISGNFVGANYEVK